MNSKVYATKIENNEGEIYRIDFDVVFEDEMGEKTNIGSYSVDDDNSIIGEVDPYMISNHFEFVPQAKKIMLKHGLAEIVGNEIPPEKYFYQNHISALKNVEGIFDRANQYIEKNKIPCTNENGCIDFSTERYRTR